MKLLKFTFLLQIIFCEGQVTTELKLIKTKEGCFPLQFYYWGVGSFWEHYEQDKSLIKLTISCENDKETLLIKSLKYSIPTTYNFCHKKDQLDLCREEDPKCYCCHKPDAEIANLCTITASDLLDVRSQCKVASSCELELRPYNLAGRCEGEAGYCGEDDDDGDKCLSRWIGVDYVCINTGTTTDTVITTETTEINGTWTEEDHDNDGVLPVWLIGVICGVILSGLVIATVLIALNILCRKKKSRKRPDKNQNSTFSETEENYELAKYIPESEIHEVTAQDEVNSNEPNRSSGTTDESDDGQSNHPNYYNLKNNNGDIYSSRLKQNSNNTDFNDDLIENNYYDAGQNDDVSEIPLENSNEDVYTDITSPKCNKFLNVKAPPLKPPTNDVKKESSRNTTDEIQNAAKSKLIDNNYYESENQLDTDTTENDAFSKPSTIEASPDTALIDNNYYDSKENSGAVPVDKLTPCTNPNNTLPHDKDNKNSNIVRKNSPVNSCNVNEEDNLTGDQYVYTYGHFRLEGRRREPVEN